MGSVTKFFKSRKAMRLLTAGVVVVGLSAPALADHFDWSAVGGDSGEPVVVTAEDAHVECPEPEEGSDPEAAKAECDAVVAGVVTELTESDHPENHGKYVSFVAHCLKGMKGKGQKVREVAQAAKGEEMEVAVRICSEYQLEQSESDDSEESSADVSDDDDDDDDDDSLESESDDEKGKGKGKGKGGKSKGKGRR